MHMSAALGRASITASSCKSIFDFRFSRAREERYLALDQTMDVNVSFYRFVSSFTPLFTPFTSDVREVRRVGGSPLPLETRETASVRADVVGGSYRIDISGILR